MLRRRKGPEVRVKMRDPEDGTWWEYDDSWWVWEPVGIAMVVLGVVITLAGLYILWRIG